LATFAANLGGVALAMAAEGVRACFHPHVGTLVETEREVRYLLDHSDPRLLGFGPDTGHLFWAGMDPAVVIGDYADRVGAVHIKDVHGAVAAQARQDGVDYSEATFRRHLWTEPGRGDVDLAGVLDVLHGHAGWWVVEVDVPDRTTPAHSAALSAAWVAEHLNAQRTEGVAS
jgi:inosose dehydratase